MLARNALLLLALSAVAGSAFAASPQAASAAQPAKATTDPTQDKRTCEERGKTGHCEKWSKSETEKAAAKK